MVPLIEPFRARRLSERRPKIGTFRHWRVPITET